ncbi:leucine-rich repeat-containing protein 71 [Cheilinus undulatus]|uniref:leucine-rich repeat-containing protein 71 n=1 Tax=Cheilinus undulatus TaxID=241271 RepID=UPI001BD60137|nr:leucine-rich repeat-containing protein 71 [Cheilinus undulatus]
MLRKKQKQKPEKANTEDEASKSIGQTPNEKLPIQTFDKYQCSGDVEIDFPQLCALLDIKDIPAVSTKQRGASNTETEGAEPSKKELILIFLTLLAKGTSKCTLIAASPWFKPRLHVELDNEDNLSAKNLKIYGWKVDEQIARVLEKMLPSLSRLQNLQFWQAGLTDETVLSLLNTISLCSNLSSVTLEGNPLPEQSFHLLLSEDSLLTHLSLRNNRIGDEGARLIGSALSTTRSANKNLLSLNLSFNSIGDAGAAHIAQGLRLNRALLFLSLSNNQIGDTGAAHLATTLDKFALTHEEVVERRKLLLERAQSSTVEVDLDQSPPDQLPSVPSSSSLSGSKGKKKEALKKAEKPVSTKENPKPNKKPTEVKVPQSKGGKLGGKERQQPAREQDGCNISLTEQQVEEMVSPLLDQSAQCRNGEIILPGNTTLTSLNLAGNRITEESLPLFLKSLQMQGHGGGGGLLRLCLQRNCFPSDCECYVKIQELMKLADPLEKSNSELTEEERQGA